jgi:hypothetical protein
MNDGHISEGRMSGHVCGVASFGQKKIEKIYEID